MNEETTNHQSKPFHFFFHGDPVIWIVFFTLCALSIVEVYSATSSLSYESGEYWFPVLKHAMFFFLGFLLLFVVHNIPYKWFRIYSSLLIPLSAFLLILTPYIGTLVNGAHRVIPIFGIPVQASELAKGAVVICVARILAISQSAKGADKRAMKLILWVTLPVCVLIAPENGSTAGILFLVVFLMMFVGRVPYKQLGKLTGAIILLGIICAFILVITPYSVLNELPMGHRTSTWKHRIIEFTSPDDNTRMTRAEDYELIKNPQVANANIAIATSNVVGKMPGNSIQRDFLSQPYSDFIYAIIIEELGFVGGAVVALLYIILLFRAGKIARRCERNFPAFTVLGLALLIVVQALINMLVAVGLFPVTGQPLPLMSRGGASILINCVYIGMMLSISRYAMKNSPSDTRQSSQHQ